MTSQLERPTTLRNRLGEIWKRRDGRTVTITRQHPDSTEPYYTAIPGSQLEHWYTCDLRSGIGWRDADLVELVYDPRAGAPECISTATKPEPSPSTTPLSSATKSCRRCAAWEQLTPHDTALGRCLRHAPVLLERNHLGANWPTTSAHDHCFDFIAKSRQ